MGVIGTQPTALSQPLPNRVENNFFQTGTKAPTDSNAVGGTKEGSGARQVAGWMLALVAVAMGVVVWDGWEIEGWTWVDSLMDTPCVEWNGL